MKKNYTYINKKKIVSKCRYFNKYKLYIKISPFSSDTCNGIICCS